MRIESGWAAPTQGDCPPQAPVVATLPSLYLPRNRRERQLSSV